MQLFETLDQLYTLRWVLEDTLEFAQAVHMCFVDLKAFDHVPRRGLWGVLQENRVRGPFWRDVRWPIRS